MDRAIIAEIQGFGFDVWMRDPSDSWLLFTTPDGKNIGYLQDERLSGGWSLSTRHKPSTTHGTGFSVFPNVLRLTPDMLRACFCIAPDWAPFKSEVVKWRDIEQYRAQSSFERELRKLKPVRAAGVAHITINRFKDGHALRISIRPGEHIHEGDIGTTQMVGLTEDSIRHEVATLVRLGYRVLQDGREVLS